MSCTVSRRKPPRSPARHNLLKPCPSPARWNGSPSRRNRAEPRCRLRRRLPFAATSRGARQQSSPWPGDRGFESISLQRGVCELSVYRDVEDLLAERGLDLSFETVRRLVLKFGPVIARGLRRRRPRPSNRWHLDEMVVRIAGKRMYLWRAVDHEGEVLDMLVQRRRDSRAAL